jgi:hypothetical protein
MLIDTTIHGARSFAAVSSSISPGEHSLKHDLISNARQGFLLPAQGKAIGENPASHPRQGLGKFTQSGNRRPNDTMAP